MKESHYGQANSMPRKQFNKKIGAFSKHEHLELPTGEIREYLSHYINLKEKNVSVRVYKPEEFKVKIRKLPPSVVISGQECVIKYDDIVTKPKTKLGEWPPKDRDVSQKQEDANTTKHQTFLDESGLETMVKKEKKDSFKMKLGYKYSSFNPIYGQ